MITTYTFGKKNNKNTKSFSFPFCTSSKPNYSKILDDIILTDIIDKNPYLFDKTKKQSAHIFLGNTSDDIILTGGPKLYDAAKFITNYKLYTKKYKLPFILGKMYTLTDGTPIVFYDDEIQIGFDV